MADLPRGITADPAPSSSRSLPRGITPDQSDSSVTSSAPPETWAQWNQNVGNAFGGGILHGAGNIWWGGKQLLSHAVPGSWSETVDKEAQARERAYQTDPTRRAHPGWATAGEIGGEIAATSPLMLVPGGQAATIARYGRAALQGAAAAGLDPVTSGKDYWHEKSKQAALGAAGGAGGEAVLGRLGRAVAPRVDPDVAELARQGVRMTPGQLATGGGRFGVGANLRRAEEVLKSWPVLGEFIRGGQTRSIEDFNIAAINQALDPIGERLPQGINAGHDAVAFMQNAASQAYDRVLTPLTFRADQQFFNNVGFQYLGGGGGVRILPGSTVLNPITRLTTPAMRREFAGIFRERVLNRMDPRTGAMSGQTMKEVESELGSLARTYSASADGRQRLIGQSIHDLQEEIRDALERQNPQAAEDLRNANLTYAMAARINNAVSRRGATPEGVFRPTDLIGAARAGDRTRMKTAFARGDALMQAISTAGQRILPGKMPDSGTPERLIWLEMLNRIIKPLMVGGAAGGAAAATGHIPELIAGTALGTLPYTPLGQRAVQAYALPAPWRTGLGQAIGDIGSYFDPAFGIIAGKQPRLDTLTMASEQPNQ